MNWLEIGLIGSVVFAIYYLQQIKMTLKDQGKPVDLFSGWVSDYKTFKAMIDQETDITVKTGWQGLLNGLHLSIIGAAVIAVLLFGNG